MIRSIMLDVSSAIAKMAVALLTIMMDWAVQPVSLEALQRCEVYITVSANVVPKGILDVLIICLYAGERTIATITGIHGLVVDDWVVGTRKKPKKHKSTLYRSLIALSAVSGVKHASWYVM